MMIGLLVLFLGAVSLAWAFARRHAEYRPIAILLSVGLGVDAVQLAIEGAILAPLRSELGVHTPWTGWAHVAGVLASAVWMVWPASIVAASLAVFARWKVWPAVAGWAVALLLFAVVHPVAGDGSEAKALAMIQTVAAVASAGILVTKYERCVMPSTPAQHALAMIVATEMVSLMGSWRIGPFDHWGVSQVLYLVLFGTLIVTQGRSLWNSLQPSL